MKLAERHIDLTTFDSIDEITWFLDATETVGDGGKRKDVRVEIHSIDQPQIYDDTNYPHVAHGKWSTSRDGENFFAMYDSKEDAIAECFPFVGLCGRPPVLAPLFGEDIIERIKCQEVWSVDAAESWGPTKSQLFDLDDMLRDTVSQWLTRHKLWPKWFIVSDSQAVQGGER